eukprot:Skav209481  [mRNA]  locus=scaffold1892:103551:109875:+ [translate_table: standard]
MEVVSMFTLFEVVTIRPKDETAEEKKARKASVKAGLNAEIWYRSKKQWRHDPVTGHGMLLRHKADSGPQAGAGMMSNQQHDFCCQAGRIFCLRECSQIEDCFVCFICSTALSQGGLGYPFLENTEISEVEMFPSEDGTVRCKMTGMGDVTSRIFRWWTGLQKDSQASAVAFLESIDEAVWSKGRDL